MLLAVAHYKICIFLSRPRGYKIFFVLNSTEKFQLLIKTKIPMTKFLALNPSNIVSIMLINCCHFNIYEQDKFRAQLI